MPATTPIRTELRALLALAAPLIAHNVAFAAMMFVDTVMSGRLSAQDLGAVAVGTAIFWPAFGLVMGLLMALTATIAHLYGAGEMDAIGRYKRQADRIALVAAAIAGVLMWNAAPFLTWIGTDPELVPRTAGYLKAMAFGMPAVCLYHSLRFTSEGVGRTTPLIGVAVVGVACNIFGNWVFMWGNLGMPQLGATGCGLATALSFTMMWLVLRRHLRTHAYYAPFRLWQKSGSEKSGSDTDFFGGIFRGLTHREPGEPWFDGARQRELATLGLPIGVMIFMESSLFAAAALMLGTLGAEIVAGHQIALNWAAFMFMVPLGLGLAATIRVGHALGAGDEAGARFRGWVGVGCAIGFMACSATVLVFAREWIVGLYTKDAAVAAVALSLLLWAAIFQLADGAQVAAASVLRGYKDTQVPAVITVVAYWGVGLPLCWGLGLALEMGPVGVWVGLTAALVTVAGLLLWRFAHRSVR